MRLLAFALCLFLPLAGGRRDMAASSFNDVVPMIIIGEGWSVQIVIQNAEPEATAGVISFHRANGEPWDLPLVEHEVINGELPLTFRGHEVVTLQTVISAGPQELGWGEIDMNCCVDTLGQVIFRKQSEGRPDLMASTPFASTMSTTTQFYDNTEGKYAGFGIVNTRIHYSWEGETTSDVQLVIRDELGREIGTHTRKVQKRGFDWFSLIADYPETAGKRGSITLTPTNYGTITTFSLQFTPNGAFASISGADAL